MHGGTIFKTYNHNSKRVLFIILLIMRTIDRARYDVDPIGMKANYIGDQLLKLKIPPQPAIEVISSRIL
jgi:hypothetical protein